MKVEGPNKASSAKGAGKAEKKKTGDGTFGAMVDETGAAEAEAPVARAGAVNALDALLTLQGAGDAGSEEASKKARQRARDLLDQLERIKMGLLTGELPVSALQQLAKTIATHREQVMDPRLAALLDDIDLRAQVELAKLER